MVVSPSPVAGDHQLLPARLAGVGLLAGVQHPARELLVEHARPNVGLDRLRHDGEGDFPEGLVGVGNGDDHHVGGHRRRDEGQGNDGPQQPVGADATGQQRDRLPVAGHPPEADEDPHQDSHRDGQPERLREEGPEDPGGGAPGHPLGQEVLEVVHHRREDQQEREDQERQEERRKNLLEDVAVDRGPHG